MIKNSQQVKFQNEELVFCSNCKFHPVNNMGKIRKFLYDRGLYHLNYYLAECSPDNYVENIVDEVSVPRSFSAFPRTIGKTKRASCTILNSRNNCKWFKRKE